jgi:hypothetical protein
MATKIVLSSPVDSFRSILTLYDSRHHCAVERVLAQGYVSGQSLDIIHPRSGDDQDPTVNLPLFINIGLAPIDSFATMR